MVDKMWDGKKLAKTFRNFDRNAVFGPNQGKSIFFDFLFENLKKLSKNGPVTRFGAQHTDFCKSVQARSGFCRESGHIILSAGIESSGA